MSTESIYLYGFDLKLLRLIYYNLSNRIEQVKVRNIQFKKRNIPQESILVPLTVNIGVYELCDISFFMDNAEILNCSDNESSYIVNDFKVWVIR